MAGHRQIIAILRGLTPPEAINVCGALCDAGITMIEVPHNSPDPLRSISAAAKAFTGRALIGCGTALSVADVDAAHGAGCTFVVSPDTNESVIRRHRGIPRHRRGSNRAEDVSRRDPRPARHSRPEGRASA
jgi:2-dehydro-3-deoxyphosphogalactonate aldolase